MATLSKKTKIVMICFLLFIGIKTNSYAQFTDITTPPVQELDFELDIPIPTDAADSLKTKKVSQKNEKENKQVVDKKKKKQKKDSKETSNGIAVKND